MKAFFALFLLLTAPALAITPAALDALMKSGQPVTLVDLRSLEDYQNGHIANAINIPHRIIGNKRLPPLGKVVAYCDGLGTTYAADCLTALNTKPGIQAELLEGGYAAWETYTNVTAEATRVAKETPRTITYQELEATQGQGVVIIDVRRDPAAVALARGVPAKEKLNLGDFRQARVPRAQVSRNAFDHLSRIRNNKKGFDKAPSLLVVIDNDDQSAMATARRIQQSGYKRVVVLAGGEEIIRRQGRAGLARQGAAAPVTLQPELVPQPIKQN